MGAWDRITSALSALFGSSEKIESPSTNIFIFGSGNTVNTDQTKKQLQLNINEALKQKPEEVKKIIKDAVLTDGYPVFAEEHKEQIEKLQDFDGFQTKKGFLDFLRNKISPGDYNILRAAIYVVEQYKIKNPEAPALKAGIRQRYGVRGSNICNVYSAGYFETLIIPFYKEISGQPDFSHKTFLRVYEIIVTEAAFSVFVNQHMGSHAIIDAIRTQIERNFKLGINYLNIHGIGKDLIKKTRKAISSLEENPEFTFRQREEMTGDAIFIRLVFNKEQGKG